MRLRPVLCLVTIAAFLTSLILSAAGIHAGSTATAATAGAFPAGMSANHRYLVDQNGQPYLIVGDSPHSIFVNTSPADADFYLADRQAHGINAIWVEALSNGYTGGRADGSTYDGIVPFTTPGDFSTPNPAYWARVDTIIQEAANHNITAFLDPVDLAGWASAMTSNGATKDRAFGVFLGNRYKGFANIVWLNGNDFQTWRDPASDANALALAQGIASSDPGHIQTIELDYNRSSSLDDQRWAGTVTLNAAYSYYPTYDEVLHAYSQTPTMPAFMVEANYEGENNTGGPATTAETLRRQEWWSMTSGATGQLYGNHTTWTFPSGWQNSLDTTGVAELGVMRSFFLSEPWQQLVPDASFITSGTGTYTSAGVDVLQSDYATAAVTPDGAHAVAYIPSARTVTVNLSRLQASVTARWIDPTNGASRPAAAPYTTPGVHADGASDWVLVFDATGGPPPTTTTVPGSTTTTVPGTTTTTTPSSHPSFKQVAAVTPQTAQTTVTVTLANPEVADDLNVIAIGWNDTVANIASVTDSGGNTYAVAAPLTRGNGISQAIYYAAHVRAGPDTVTVTFSTGAHYVDLRLAEYAGAATLDTSGSATGNGGTASASVATTGPNELVVGAATCGNNIYGAGPGFTARIITQPDLDILQDRVTTTAGTYTASTTGSPGGWTAQAVAFAATTSTPPPTTTTTVPPTTTTTTVPATTTTTTVPATTTTTTTVPPTTTTTVPVTTTTTKPPTTTTTTPSSHPSFKQVAAVTPQTAQTTVTVTLANPEVADDLNVIAIGWNDTVANIASVTDSGGNTYAVAAPLTRGNGISQAIYYAAHVRAGPDTVTVTFSTGAHYVDLRLAEYAGAATLDTSGSATGNGGTASASVATTGPNELVVGAATCGNNIYGAGPGFTARIITQPDLDILQDRVTTTAGTYTASTTGSPGGWTAQAVAFR